MLTNIVDRRTNKYDVRCDAAIEPSCHDNSVSGSTQFEWTEVGPSECCVEMVDGTVEDAIRLASDRTWPVTIFLYDPRTAFEPKPSHAPDKQRIIPLERLSPGDFLGEELFARDWSVEEFSRRCKKSPDLIQEIIYDAKEVTPEIAKVFGNVLGTSAELWINLEAQYRKGV